MQILRLTKVGTSTGTIIPKEMLSRLKVHQGDTLFAIETAEGLAEFGGARAFGTMGSWGSALAPCWRLYGRDRFGGLAGGEYCCSIAPLGLGEFSDHT